MSTTSIDGKRRQPTSHKGDHDGHQEAHCKEEGC
jgi:hypothetical protein